LDGQFNDNGDPITSVDGGTIIFKNSQRAFVTEAIDTLSTFMRTSKSSVVNSKTKKSNPIIRLMFDSPMGYHRQIAIGLNKKASNGFDMGYDAFIADINEEDMYWTVDGGKFVIQGVNNFDKTQEFPFELKVKKSGAVKIKLDSFENIDPNLSLFIKDNSTGQTHQINDKVFKMYLEAGIYKDRFKLVFQSNKNRLLSTEKVDIIEYFTVFYDSKVKELNIVLEQDIQVSNVDIYNFAGRKITSLKTTSRENAIPIKMDNGVYIVKLNTENGISTKKILIK
jgi:hypothetical protein